MKAKKTIVLLASGWIFGWMGMTFGTLHNAEHRLSHQMNPAVSHTHTNAAEHHTHDPFNSDHAPLPFDSFLIVNAIPPSTSSLSAAQVTGVIVAVPSLDTSVDLRKEYAYVPHGPPVISSGVSDLLSSRAPPFNA